MATRIVLGLIVRTSKVTLEYSDATSADDAIAPKPRPPARTGVTFTTATSTGTPTASTHNVPAVV
jgi:hypothetical protein